MPHSQKAADQAVDWSLEKGEMTMPRIIPIRDLKDTTAISQMCKESREPVFITKNGYGDMVKVFPHNLRHLFARTFYQIYRDVAGLADVLGYSSVETTRLYLITTSKKYAQKLGQLNLIS